MNGVRLLISVCLGLLLAISVAGWYWTVGKSMPNINGARAVLVLCALSAVGGLGLLWSEKTTRPT